MTRVGCQIPNFMYPGEEDPPIAFVSDFSVPGPLKARRKGVREDQRHSASRSAEHEGGAVSGLQRAMSPPGNATTYGLSKWVNGS
jgi:hypothetical protein